MSLIRKLKHGQITALNMSFILLFCSVGAHSQTFRTFAGLVSELEDIFHLFALKFEVMRSLICVTAS